MYSSIWPTLINSQRRRGVQIKEWTWTPAAGDEPIGCSLRLNTRSPSNSTRNSTDLYSSAQSGLKMSKQSSSGATLCTDGFPSSSEGLLTLRISVTGRQVHVKSTNKSKYLLSFHFSSPKLSCHSDSACQPSSRLLRST